MIIRKITNKLVFGRAYLCKHKILSIGFFVGFFRIYLFISIFSEISVFSKYKSILDVPGSWFKVNKINFC